MSRYFPAQIFGLLLFLVAAGETNCHAGAGTEGAAFLNIPMGGRPAALGGAYTALANDAYAPVFNPAGLGFSSASQLAAMHLSFIDSIAYEFASIALPFSGHRALGAAVQYFRPGDIPGTDLNGNSTGNFSGSFSAYSVGYGQALNRTVSLGAVAKSIRGEIASESASSYAADLGVMIKPSKEVGLAVVAANLGSKLKFVDEGDALPSAIKLGGYYRLNTPWLFALQATRQQHTGLTSAQTGIEWTPGGVLSLRAGYRTETSRELSSSGSWTAGVGLHLAGQQFDYAWVPLGDLGNTQYFSLVIQWGEHNETVE